MPQTAIIALSSLIGILGLWIMFVTLWRYYGISRLRQDLFDLRGELFDLALSDEELPFDHPAYTSLRTTLNSLIRFAHRMTFLRFAATLYLCRDQIKDQTASAEWKARVRGLPDRVKDQLSGIRFRMHLSVASYSLHVPSFLINRYLARLGRKKTSYIGKSRSQPRGPKAPISMAYRTHLVAAIRELEHQAQEDREHEVARQKTLVAV